MSENVKFWGLTAIIYIGLVLSWYYFTGDFSLSSLFLCVILTICTLLIIACVRNIIWRIENGVDVFATLETKEEDVKRRMLFIMLGRHTGGIAEAFDELNAIFRNYPQWNLSGWDVFRSWYKENIDYMVKYEYFYGLKDKTTGEPYIKENDPLYDLNAKDWEELKYLASTYDIYNHNENEYKDDNDEYVYQEVDNDTDGDDHNDNY